MWGHQSLKMIAWLLDNGTEADRGLKIRALKAEAMAQVREHTQSPQTERGKERVLP